MSERIADSTIVSVLDRAVAGINPVLDAIGQRDPLGLKGTTFPALDSAEPASRSRLRSVAGALQKALGKVLDLVDVPGTKGWSDLPIDQRASWWVSRIGALNTVAVAFPGIFGIWARRLPLTDVLGLANQAMVLVAVARELGVTDRSAQVRMLAELLFDRRIDVTPADLPNTAAEEQAATVATSADPEKQSRSLLRTLWQTGQKLRSLDDELGHRELPNKFFRFVSNFPIVGAPATYLGERFALGRAAKQARRWVATHRDGTTTPSV